MRSRPVMLLLLALCAAGCRRDMFEQPKSNPLSDSRFFRDHAASRPIPPHTVTHDDAPYDQTFYTGMAGTNLVTEFPMPVTREMLERGRQRFEINCVPCHGETGQGDGIVVRRGFPAPPDYSIDRLRAAPAGHFFDVMTRGYGAMYPFASRVTPADRWAIAAYIRALQLSGHAAPADVPAGEMAQLQTQP